MFCHLGVEVVHEHAHGRLLRPALAGQFGAPGGTDRARAGGGPAHGGGGSHRQLLIESACRPGEIAGLRVHHLPGGPDLSCPGAPGGVAARPRRVPGMPR
jgi:hypothetical protein